MRIALKSGIRNFLQFSGPVQTYTGIALPNNLYDFFMDMKLGFWHEGDYIDEVEA